MHKRIKQTLMSDLLLANVTVADRSFRLKVSPEDEAVLRQTVKLINEKINEFKLQLAGKDMQDYVSMALLWFVTSQNKSSEILLNQKQNTDLLLSIEHLLDKAIANEQEL